MFGKLPTVNDAPPPPPPPPPPKTFSPPSLNQLSENTKKLDYELAVKLNRYPIVRVEKHALPSANLKWWIDRTEKKVVNAGSKRGSVKNVFEKLVNKFRAIDEHDDTESRNAVAFLLGALVHRYLRILQEYDDHNARVMSSLLQAYPSSCKMFMAIRSALSLKKVTGDYITVEKFKKMDLKVIDSATIVTVLEIFRDNMYENDHYKEYRHLAEDINFKSNLKKMIKQHKLLASQVLVQLQAVRFIQSVESRVSKKHLEIMPCLNLWHAKLLSECSDFSKLTINFLQKHSSEHITDPSKKIYIQKLLSTKFIHDSLTADDSNYDLFLTSLKQASAILNVYTLIGGYAVLLNSKKTMELKYCLYAALGVAEYPKILDTYDMQFPLKFFAEFLEEHPTEDLNFKYFDTRDALVSIVVNLKEEYSKKFEALVVNEVTHAPN